MSNDADESEPDGATNDGAGGDQPEAERDSDAADGDQTVPEVDLSLRNLSVSVSGRSEDDLETVEQSALALMEHLVDKAESLEENHDEYGLS